MVVALLSCVILFFIARCLFDKVGEYISDVIKARAPVTKSCGEMTCKTDKEEVLLVWFFT